MFVDTDHDGLASLADLVRAVTNDPGGLTASYLGLDTSSLSIPAVSASTRAQRAAFSDGIGEQLQHMLNWDATATCKHLDRKCLDVPTFCELFNDPHPPPPLRAVCWQQEDTTCTRSKKNMGDPNDDELNGEDHSPIEDTFEQQEGGEPGSTLSVGEAILAPPRASAPPATSTTVTSDAASDARKGRMRTLRKIPSRFSVRVLATGGGLTCRRRRSCSLLLSSLKSNHPKSDPGFSSVTIVRCHSSRWVISGRLFSPPSYILSWFDTLVFKSPSARA